MAGYLLSTAMSAIPSAALEYVKSTPYYSGAAAVAVSAAMGVKYLKWGLNLKQFLEKKHVFKVVLKDVLAAQRYVDQVKAWAASIEVVCEKEHAHLFAVLRKTEKFLDTNFFRSDLFLKNVVDIETLTNETLDQLSKFHSIKDDQLQRLKQTGLLLLNPESHRQKLGLHMIRVIEIVSDFKLRYKKKICERASASSARARIRGKRPQKSDVIKVAVESMSEQDTRMAEVLRQMHLLRQKTIDEDSFGNISSASISSETAASTPTKRASPKGTAVAAAPSATTTTSTTTATPKSGTPPLAKVVDAGRSKTSSRQQSARK